MAKIPLKMKPLSKCIFGREHAIRMWQIKSWYSDSKYIFNQSPSHSQSDQEVGETVESCKLWKVVYRIDPAISLSCTLGRDAAMKCYRLLTAWNDTVSNDAMLI